jgi:hypothetical protein
VGEKVPPIPPWEISASVRRTFFVCAWQTWVHNPPVYLTKTLLIEVDLLIDKDKREESDASELRREHSEFLIPIKPYLREKINLRSAISYQLGRIVFLIGEKSDKKSTCID